MTKETSLNEYKTVSNAIITLGDTDDSGKGRHFKSRFIQPGLAGYPGQFGNALIKKENLDKFVHTLRNKPVTINHKDNIGDDDKVGEVLNVWYNPEDGWYWCDGIITDETAQNLIQDKKWSVSCSYDFTKYDDEGGTENNIPYDIEFLDGEFNHLAIVDNPRYEGANIVFNSKDIKQPSFKERFIDTFYEALTEVIVENCVNNDKWITIHPNGKDEKGRPLKLEDGESPKEAIKRTYGVDLDKTKEDSETTIINPEEIKQKIFLGFKGNTKLIEKAFNNAHKDKQTNLILKNFNKLGEIEFKKVDLDKGCFIPPFASELSTIKADSEWTFYHEFGHSLDCRLGKKLEPNNVQFNWLSMELTEVNKEVISKLNFTLPKDLEKTFKKWDEKVKTDFSNKYIESGIFSKEILEKARKKYKNFDDLSEQLKFSILDDFGRESAEKYFKQIINANPDYKKWSVLSDIYSALTMGRDREDKFLGKHSQEYWDDANFGLKIGKSANINSEIFANYVEMRMGNFTEQLNYLKNNEPKLYKKLDSLYNKVAMEIENL